MVWVWVWGVLLRVFGRKRVCSLLPLCTQVAQLEISRGGNLQTLVFPLPSCVVRLHHDADVLECRKHALLAVKRDNPWSKIESFMSLAANANDT